MIAEPLNGKPVACLCSPELPKVEVIHSHITRRRIVPGVWPRTQWDYPCSRRPVVVSCDGVRVPVHVTLIERDGYIIAAGHQDHVCRGENVEAGGAFTRDNELEAERLALEGL